MGLLNKKGSEKILSVYWFVILSIIATAIVLMVSLFYNYPYDVREVESNLFIDYVSNCLSSNGFFNKTLLFSDDFSLYSFCNLNFNVGSSIENSEGNYYLELRFFNLSSGSQEFSIFEGSPSFLADCELSDEDYGRLAVCVNKVLYLSDEFGDVYKINIISVIRKTEKNVK